MTTDTSPTVAAPGAGRRVAQVVIAGLGHHYRRDDGVGQLVAARAVELAGSARDIGPVADPLDLLGRWEGADLAIVCDALASGDAAGTIRTIEVGPVGTAAQAGSSGDRPSVASTHDIGLTRAIRLARALDRAPGRVVVVGVEGADFGTGEGLSPLVEAALPRAVALVVSLIREAEGCA